MLAIGLLFKETVMSISSLRPFILLAFLLASHVSTAFAQVTRIEQNDPSIVYSGNWYSNSSEQHSYRDAWSGIARVYIDGQLQSTTDDYQSPSQTRTVLYNVGGLPRGTHTLEIEVTGTRNSSSKGSWIWVDAFDIAP